MCFIQIKINRLLKKIKVMATARLQSQPTKEILAEEAALYRRLAALYHSAIGKRKFPFAHAMEIASFRAAASLDDPIAQFLLGRILLNEARFRHSLQQGVLFQSVSNEQQMQRLYTEAHGYLLSAEKQGHIEAKRLRGLAYINGWGVQPDKTAGFELIVESIDQENSWDKVPQLFASMGLNTPEFFSALAKRREKK